MSKKSYLPPERWLNYVDKPSMNEINEIEIDGYTFCLYLTWYGEYVERKVREKYKNG